MDAVNLFDFEAQARERLDPAILGFISGGAADETPLRDNVAAFGRYRLLPHVLVDVPAVDVGVTVLGQRLQLPVLLAPTAFQSLAHPDGELTVARAAAAAGTALVASTVSSRTLEDSARGASGPKWFQLYCYRDPAVTRRFVERAETAGYGAVRVAPEAAPAMWRSRSPRLTMPTSRGRPPRRRSTTGRE